MQGSGGFHGRQSAAHNASMPDGEKKMMKQMQDQGLFSEKYKQDIDMKKINFEVIKPWIKERVIEMMGFEDDIVIEFAYEQLTFEKVEAHQKVDPKKFQMNMTPFLGKHAAKFCHELWDHLLSAQSHPEGIPEKFLQDKQLELIEKRRRAEEIERQIASGGGAATASGINKGTSPYGANAGYSNPGKGGGKGGYHNSGKGGGKKGAWGGKHNMMNSGMPGTSSNSIPLGAGGGLGPPPPGTIGSSMYGAGPGNMGGGGMKGVGKGPPPPGTLPPPGTVGNSSYERERSPRRNKWD